MCFYSVSYELRVAELAAFSKAQEAAVEHGGAIVRTTAELGVPEQHAVRACEQRPAQPAQQARTVFVVMFSIKVPDLRVDKLNKGDAEHLLQRAMCSIEGYCPLVVRYIRASGHLE
jgi:hypothetical protein